MKKITLKSIFLICVVCLTSSLNCDAQEIRLGVHAGIPTGDIGDYSSLNVGADAAVYFLPVTETLNLGIATGYTHFVGKDKDGLEVSDIGYIPVAASGRGTFNNGIIYIADIGYGIGMNDAEGGLYYKGKLGWSSGNFDAYFYYGGISAKETDVTSVGLGVAFKVL